ncbi:hypothetical protein [Roseofilum casamattae]|uniref:Type II toxin-antitoxin system Phd/YefM family antitoxin n=1 Tax=Roseofilum casamattae BLCC-M143 TaxID=3022442 RepID=A0ABT7BXD4_9CYAN|nr:hypothetical protein [Roseofilum casamattae]MDJ1183820.1 hypothetical protein [Roseofilum casamattae BLCC-M143]
MKEITITELPESLQHLAMEVAQTKNPLAIMHEGKPLAIVYPARIL